MIERVAFLKCSGCKEFVTANTQWGAVALAQHICKCSLVNPVVPAPVPAPKTEPASK